MVNNMLINNFNVAAFYLINDKIILNKAAQYFANL